MNVLNAALAPPLAPQWAAATWLLLAAQLFACQRRPPRDAPLHGMQQHLWFAGAVLIGWSWTMQAQQATGVEFGLLGVALYSLIFGRFWASFGLLADLALHTGLGGGDWSRFGINGLLLVSLPTLLTAALQRQIAVRLPKNLFVFIIGNGLFVTLAVTAATSVTIVLLGGLLQPAAARAEQLAFALLLAWGEALASGMLFSALVVFVPQLVRTYRQDLYLPPWRGI